MPSSACNIQRRLDRKSTRLNSSHSQISYAVFCLKKKIGDGPFVIMPLIIATMEIQQAMLDRIFGAVLDNCYVRGRAELLASMPHSDPPTNYLMECYRTPA